MIRQIKYTILSDFKGIEPKNKQWGGMQYEDNATEVVFDLGVFRGDILHARIDFNSPAAGYHPSENIAVLGNTITRAIPKYITQYGGEIQATAVITLSDTEECLSYPVNIYFTSVERSEGGDKTVEGNISEMENKVKELLDETKDLKDDAENAADVAATEAASAQRFRNETEGMYTEIVEAGVTAEALSETKREAEDLVYIVEQKLEKGEFVGEPGPPGPEGPRGNDYVLTEADKEEISNMAKPPIDQTFTPTSPNAQSGIAIEERLKSRVLLDVTLNAEQAGATSLSLEIADAETLANAKEIQLHISFPCAESKGAGKVWTGANIKYPSAYNIPILSTDNSACSAGSKLYTTSRTFIYGISEYSGVAASKTSFSIIQRSNQYIASAANSRTAPSSMNSNYPYGLMVNPQTPPSLVITNSIAFEAGTRVYMEVYY